MRIRRSVLLFILVLVVALAALLYPKPCEQYDGMSIGGSQSWSCQCAGIKVMTQDDAPADGFTIKKCFGLATHHVCSKWVGIQRHGEVLSVPCDQK